MVLISGTKAAQKRIGWAADYCHVCLEVREFEILAQGIGRHVYFVSTGLTETHAHLKKCCSCHFPSRTDLSLYQKVMTKRPRSLDELVQDTFPALPSDARIETGNDWKAAAVKLTPQERQDLMVQVLQLFNPLVEHRYANWSDFDKYSGSGCLTTILVIALCINRGCAHIDDKTNDQFASWVHAIGYALITGFVITLVLAVFGPSRFMKHEIIPGIAHGLRYLNPSDEELKMALERSRGLRLKIARKIPASVLQKKLHEIQG